MRKNTKSKTTKSITSLNMSFNTGDMFWHPNGFEEFKKRSEEIQRQRNRVNDSNMLRTSAHFQRR